MIVAQAVLEIFCSQGSIGLQWESQNMLKKGHNTATTSLTDKKKRKVSAYISWLLHISNFKILSLTVFDRMQA